MLENIIYAAYCGNDATILQFCFLCGMLKDELYRNLINPKTFKAMSDPAELFKLHFVATDGFAHYMRQTLAEMDEETFQLYLQYHFATCERTDMVGYSNHTLDIFRKD